MEDSKPRSAGEVLKGGGGRDKQRWDNNSSRNLVKMFRSQGVDPGREQYSRVLFTIKLHYGQEESGCRSTLLHL